jgi:hypothetical protein
LLAAISRVWDSRALPERRRAHRPRKPICERIDTFLEVRLRHGASRSAQEAAEHGDCTTGPAARASREERFGAVEAWPRTIGPLVAARKVACVARLGIRVGPSRVGKPSWSRGRGRGGRKGGWAPSSHSYRSRGVVETGRMARAMTRASGFIQTQGAGFGGGPPLHRFGSSALARPAPPEK